MSSEMRAFPDPHWGEVRSKSTLCDPVEKCRGNKDHATPKRGRADMWAEATTRKPTQLQHSLFHRGDLLFNKCFKVSV